MLQPIARVNWVNRVVKGKRWGFIVAYGGLARHLGQPGASYAADDQKDILDTLRDITLEIAVLEGRYSYSWSSVASWYVPRVFPAHGSSLFAGFCQRTVEIGNHVVGMFAADA